ncbi:unnamed protein product [Sympodiomycopsis kandeliae]
MCPNQRGARISVARQLAEIKSSRKSSSFLTQSCLNYMAGTFSQRNSSTTHLKLLDGGQATHLESLGYDLSSALWSASLLDSPDDEGSICRVHADYLESGSDMIGTLTYQLSDEARKKAGWSEKAVAAKVPGLFEKAIQLAVKARDDHANTKDKSVALTLGPYGAALANGSEYTGDYAVDVSQKQPSLEELKEFHLKRLYQAFSQPSSDAIDCIAFETIPRLDEALAILKALEDLAKSELFNSRRRPPAYLSFVFPPDTNGFLPWLNDTPQRAGPSEIIHLLATQSPIGSWPITGIGINCTKPCLLRPAAIALSEAQSKSSTHAPLSLFLYPDGGLTWDGINRRWLQANGAPAEEHADADANAQLWAEELVALAKEAGARGNWENIWLGGCCKTGPSEISHLKKTI